MSRNPSCTIYVGNLPADVWEREIEDLFFKYGPIVDIDLKKPPRLPAFCFVEFEDARDAEDAVKGRDGYKYDGQYLRLAHGGRGLPPSTDRHSSVSSAQSSVPRKYEFRVHVSKLPPSASSQDLKDHMRKAGNVSFAQVFREAGGTVGIVDYTNHEDMKYAIRKLDDSEFRNRYSHSFIRVQEERGNEEGIHRDLVEAALIAEKLLDCGQDLAPILSPSPVRPVSRSQSKLPPPKVSKGPMSRRSTSRSPSRSRSLSRSPKARSPS